MTKNKFSLLRKQKGVTLEEVSSATGVAPTYLKKIESGGVFPASKTLTKLAEFYGVAASFFAEDIAEGVSVADTIPMDTLYTMHGEPVWHFTRQKWYLFNGEEKVLIDVTGKKVYFSELEDLYFMKQPITAKTDTTHLSQKNINSYPAIPLKRREVLASKQVYVESITSDKQINKQLSGIYDVIPEKECVQKGNIKFQLRYLGKRWLAFHIDDMK